jgi:hypothetical protein
MSWATCYSGTNNIHFNSPPLMLDGRIYTSWQPTAYVNNQIKQKAGIETNWEYRKYLHKHASDIMKYNSFSYCNELGLPTHVSNDKTVSPNVPFMFQSIHDESKPNYGYSESKLKNPYLTRQQLQARLISPAIYLKSNPI